MTEKMRYISAVLSMIWLAYATPVMGALLDGKTMKVMLTHQATSSSQLTGDDSFDFVVGPGVEVTNLGADQPAAPPFLIVNVDISDNQVLITAVNDQPFAFLERLEIFDSNFTIPTFFNRVSVNPATNWPGMVQGRIGVAGETIPVNLSELTGLAGQQIVLDVVPEPAAVVLFLAGGVLAAVFRRRA